MKLKWLLASAAVVGAAACAHTSYDRYASNNSMMRDFQYDRSAYGGPDRTTAVPTLSSTARS